MTEMKILYFGDASWGARALKEVVARGHQVLGVVLRVRPTVGDLGSTANELGLPVYQPKNCNDDEFLRVVTTLEPDLNLSVSYDQILRKPILESAQLGFVNFHAGKLPWYRGRSVVNWAIINGEEEVGVTAHFMDEGIDTGDIILQRTLPIGWSDTYAEVLAGTVEAFVPLVADTVDLLRAGNYSRTVQSHLPGSYFPRRGPGDEWLDWHDTGLNIYNKIRGIAAPAPGARTLLDDREVVVWGARYQLDWPSYIATPGQVVGVEDDGVRIKSGDSTIVVTAIEFPDDPSGGRHQPRLRIGTRFGKNLEARLAALEAQLSREVSSEESSSEVNQAAEGD